MFTGLWAATWRHRRRTLLALALLVVAKLTAVAVPLVLKAVVDRFSDPAALSAPLAPGARAHGMGLGDNALVLPVFLLLAYALLRFAGTLFTELRDLVFARVTLRTVADFAERTFAHLMALDPRFHLQRNTGGLVRDIDRGTEGVGFLLGAGLFTILPTLVEFGAVLVVLGAGYGLWFMLVIMVTFFVYAGFTMTLTHKRELRQRRVNEVDTHAHARMVDGLINYETVKTHGREDFERQRYAEVLGQWVEGSVVNQRALSLLHVGQSAIIAVGVAVVMLLAGEQTLRGVMTVGDLVLVNAYVIQICLPLNALGFVFREARDALVNVEHLFGLLAQRSEVQDPPGRAELMVRGGAVRFEHVDFAYEAGRPILFDVNLDIAPGGTVAVVGGSGSGKSTLARLLLRMYDVGGGRITVDGQDLRHVRMGSLRDAIGVVPQDTVLFNDSIAYNIGYGRTGTGMAEVIAAAQAAQVHEFIMSLPQGYDTVVGERGLKLSGGEKQRIAIARAFLKNPPIMIFDEATSALDTRAERAIQGELDRISRGRTTLVIAHRLSTVIDADEIIVMDKGHIVERGRHEALIEQAGLYAQLWNLQRQQQQFDRVERRLARQPVNLAVLVAGAIEGLREAFEAKQVRLFSDIELDDASVTGDPSTLAQVMRELGLWALQATPPGGRIEVGLQRQGPDVRLSLADGRHLDGRPLPPGALGGVAAGEATPLDPLALRSTIERQGGRFLVESPTPQRGMRYVIELPLRAVQVPPPRTAAPLPAVPGAAPMSSHAASYTAAHTAAAADPGPAAAEGVQGRTAPLAGLRIACIDDQPEALQALGGVLAVEGASVQPFDSGTAVLAWLQARPVADWPDLLVCDIALGNEDGHAVVRRLRALEGERGVPLTQRVPAVALTGFAGAEHRLRALMAGFQMHLAKPVAPQALVQTLQALAGRGIAAAGPTQDPPHDAPREAPEEGASHR